MCLVLVGYLCYWLAGSLKGCWHRNNETHLRKLRVGVDGNGLSKRLCLCPVIPILA
jgi:hypothetical protein